MPEFVRALSLHAERCWPRAYEALRKKTRWSRRIRSTQAAEELHFAVPEEGHPRFEQ
jgi:hypothetical protein